MKSTTLKISLLCIALSSCSSHYYKINGPEVTLYLKKPEAQSASFFCSLNGFKGQKLQQHQGAWELTLPVNNSFRYFYKIDGETFLPPCRMKEKDDFGSENCIFEPNL